jgi:hypothetical protein
MAKKTALAKDPKAGQKKETKPKPDTQAARTSYLSTVRNLENLEQGTPEYNKAVEQVRKYGKQLGYETGRIDTAINKYTGRQGPNQQQRIERGMGGLIEQGLQQAQQFDPTKFQQQYEPQFEQGMQRAYENIYGQFERANAERFGREQQQLQQSLAERGLDPSGEAYKSLQENLYKQQQMARQEAQSAAWNAAQGYQQQGYQQAAGTALLPGQVSEPYLNLYAQQSQMNWQAKQAELERQNREKLAKMSGGGGGGGGVSASERALAQYVMNQYGQPQQQGQSNLNAATQGLAQGVGAGITAGLLRPS